MADRIAVRWGFVVSACLILAGCGREREIVPLPEAPGPASKVALAPLELTDGEAFDRLDRRILASGGPALVECLIDIDETVLPMVPSGKPIEQLVLEPESILS